MYICERMYYRWTKDFTKQHIQGLDCWVPPVGSVIDRRTGDLVYTGVYERSEVKSEQMWEIPPAPDDYEELREEEEHRQASDPDYFDPKLEAYRRTEWFRRLNGFWFMNNGRPTYITGHHYYYLAHWRIDVGPPKFWWADLLYFYFWQYCVDDPNCGGMLSFDRRRAGKSWKASSILTEIITRSQKALGGIQSKNASDARDVFQLFVVEGFSTLPHYFKPEYDLSQGDKPKQEFRFFATTNKGAKKKARKVVAINSRINFKDASERAYDGKKLRIAVLDEFGKLEDADLAERHRVLQYCIKDGAKIVGKLLYTTTVEDIKNSDCLEKSRKMFDDSDPAKRNANGQTGTLLYRFRLPFYESYIMDEYGMPLREEAKLQMQNMLDEHTRNGDYVSLASERRKNPWNDDDIFRLSGGVPIFNIMKLSSRSSELSWRNESEELCRGTLVWTAGQKNTSVRFLESSNGRFLFNRQMLDFCLSSAHMQDIRQPWNRVRFVVGIDPYDHNTSVEPSKGAAYLFGRFDPMRPDLSNRFLVEYCARPNVVAFWQDMVKLCVFTGASALIENQKNGLITHFEQEGYSEYLIYRQGQKNPGIHAGTATKQHGTELLDDYIDKHCHLIDFKGLVDDLMLFDPADSLKRDRSMAAMWALMAAGPIMMGEQVAEEAVEDIGDYIKTYKIRAR